MHAVSIIRGSRFSDTQPECSEKVNLSSRCVAFFSLLLRHSAELQLFDFRGWPTRTPTRPHPADKSRNRFVLFESFFVPKSSEKIGFRSEIFVDVAANLSGGLST